MRLAYLLLVHNNPDQLKRLVNRLANPDTDIYIHVDKKADEGLFRKEIDLPGVFFVKKRESVNWGGYSIVKATINGFTAIADAGVEYSYITLLSGQDYPIKPDRVIQDFFRQNPGKAFMVFESIKNEWVEALPRLQKYFLTDYVFPGSTRVEGLINSFFPTRKQPGSLVFVGRSQWFSITLDHVKYILKRLKEYPQLERFFRFTWGSDEFVFQTILYNSPFKDQMVKDNFRYTDWSAGGASPKTLSMEDKDALITSPALFGRKFDQRVDSEVMDLLDKLNIGRIQG